MKVSEITTTDIAEYLHLDEISASDISAIEMGLNAAVSFVCGYTGLTAVALDNYPDITDVIFVLVQDMFDNRTYYVDKSNLNKLVEHILGMHSVNLI